MSSSIVATKLEEAEMWALRARAADDRASDAIATMTGAATPGTPEKAEGA